MSKIKAISVSIKANTKNFEKGMKRTRAALNDSDSQFRQSAKTIAQWGAAAATAAAGVTAALVKVQLASTKNLAVLASNSNTSVANFQREAYAAQQVGIEQDKLGDVYKDVRDRIGDFMSTGGGPMLDFFEKVAPKVGLTADAFKNLSGKDALQLFVKSMEDVGFTSEEVFAQMEAMAGEASRLVPLFANNAEGMDMLTQKAKDLGIGLSEIQVDKAIEAQHQLDTIGSIIDNEMKTAIAELAPFITAIAKDFISMSQDAGGGANVIIEAFKGVAMGIARVGDFIRGLEAAWIVFKMAGLGATTVITGAFKGLFQIVTTVGNTILEGWKQIFNELSKMAGVFSDDAADMMKGIADGIDGMKGKVPDLVNDMYQSQVQGLANAKRDLDELASQPMPTNALKDYFVKIEEDAAVTGSKVAELLRNGGKNKNDEEGEGGEGEKPMDDAPAFLQGFDAEKFIEETEAMTLLLGERYASAEQQQLIAIDNEIANLLRKKERGVRLTEDENRELERLYAARGNAEESIINRSGSSILSAMAQHSEKAAKLQKGYAIYQAGMSIATGIARAQELGFPANLAEMARVAVVGSKVLSDIKGASKGSAGVQASGGGASVAPPVETAPQQDSGGMSKTFNVNLTGQSQNTEAVRDLLDMINAETDNGFQLNTSGA